jgi:hypothetical protein
VTHECFEKMNGRLAPHNAKLATAFGISNDLSQLSLQYLVATEKLDSSKRSKKPPIVIMNYCPFCGESLKAKS